MIQSFLCPKTERLFRERRAPKGWLPADLVDRALNKLTMLNAATILDDLKVPPGNKLEALKGDRRGQHSIRINDQWRICFVFGGERGVQGVEITKHYR